MEESMNSIRRRFILGATITSLVLAAGPLAAQERSFPTITVTGEGTATAPSDMAIVTVGVVTRAATAAEAMAQNSRAMTGVSAAAKQAGIEARDIETSRVSLQPQYSYPGQGSREAPKLVGYEAANNVSIRVRAIDKLGGLLDQLVTSGANQVRGVELTLAKPGPLRDQARTAAMKDAMRKAEQLANAAGVKIVRLFSATEDFAEPPRPMMRMAADAAERAPVPIEAGEQEVRGRVTAVFEIAPK
jgi:uncharacterized protein YggE